MTATANQAVAAMRVVQAVADAVREAGEIPAGTLYAALMQSGCTLERFEWIIGILTEAGVVRREASHLLRWVGQ